MAALLDLTTFPPFERLIVLERGPNTGTSAQWWCMCVCGTRCLVRGVYLISGHTKSCGCLKKEGNHLTHGMTKTPEYQAWIRMKKRCFSIHSKDYPRYGGRGITVCERWKESFPAFLTDMGTRPSPAHSLDRYPDNDGPYSPDNCRWATDTEQSRNRRKNRHITIDGRTACLAEWFVLTGTYPSLFYQRIRKGWSAEQALTTPVKQYKERI